MTVFLSELKRNENWIAELFHLINWYLVILLEKLTTIRKLFKDPFFALYYKPVFC